MCVCVCVCVRERERERKNLDKFITERKGGPNFEASVCLEVCKNRRQFEIVVVERNFLKDL